MAVSPYNDLYRAHQFARDNLSTPWFPRYKQEYVDSQTGLKQRAIRVYNQVHTISSTISGVIFFIPNKIISVVSYIFENMPNFSDHFIFKYPKKVYNYVLPINPINQKRQGFRWVDKILGDWIFYPIYTFGETPSTEALSGNRNVSQPVSRVMNEILQHNKDLLNPEGQTQFDYRVQTVCSNMINAFCVPGGGMVVFSQIVKELYGSIESKAIQEATVTLPDGSKATIDLRDVTLEDALAALMGHEMTHAAARHSTVGMIAATVSFIVKRVIQEIGVQYLKYKDPEYRALANRQGPLSEAERATLEQKERKLEVFISVLHLLEKLYRLIRSRENEIESDVAGVYLAKRVGKNLLGAIYLQEFLQKKDLRWYRIEALCSHPNAEKRKLAVLSAIISLAKENGQLNALRGKIQLKKIEKYEFRNSHKLTELLG